MFKKLIEQYRVPKKFSDKIVEYNFRYFRLSMIPLFVFSVVSCLTYVILDISGGEYMRCSRTEGADFFYYSTLSIFTLIAVIYVRIIEKRRFGKKHKNIICYTMLAVMFAECVFLCYGCEHAINGFVIFACVSMVTVLFFKVCPFSIVLYETVSIAIMTPKMLSVYGTPILFNTYVFLFLSFLMVFSNTRAYITDMEKSEQLKENNKELSSSVIAVKEQKIHNLNIVVKGMASVIETRDNDTGNHIQRTSEYVKMIAERLRENGDYTDEITDVFIDMVERASPMHDIGKIAIPDNILRKPGKLTPEEFEIIKTHTTEGEKMVNMIFGKLELERPEYRDIIDAIVVSHHEKWNGSGYPNGLAGEEIPLCARIMAAADVFDALVSKRCYKEAFPVEKALEIIEKDSGTHFDPAVARAVVELKDKLKEMLMHENE